jgi:hypothetical protein
VDIKETQCVGVDQIHQDQDKTQWQALVNTIMNLPVPYKVVDFLES